MTLEFVDDMARGSRWWDEVGHYDVDDDVDVDEEAKGTVSRRDRGATTNETLEGPLHSGTTVIDTTKDRVAQSELRRSRTTEMPLAFLLEDALTN
jgi:hypothetical protein